MPAHTIDIPKQPDPPVRSCRIKAPGPMRGCSSLLDNRCWLARQYYDYRLGTRAIAAAVDTSRETVRRRLHRHGIEPRRSAWSSSPYYDHTWLTRRYVEEHGSLRRCASLAGVAPTTIRRWLVGLGIELRDRQQAAARRRACRYP